MRYAFRFGLIVLLVATCVLAAWQSRTLAQMRRTGVPETATAYAADVPPGLNFLLVGLGGFRGVAAEVLWFRAARLQEQGRYLELVQLARWITLLDPHAAENWAYNAWNLAYNISVMMSRPEDRLRWVLNGITLLRDDGLRYNPKSARLYRELAWLFQNKIGDTQDSAHLTYKFYLAEAMKPFVQTNGLVKVSDATRQGLAAWRMDLGRMVSMEKEFGPLDWRLAPTHALYWALQGIPLATGPDTFLAFNAVCQPLIILSFNGRFVGDFEKRMWRTAAHPRLAVAAAKYMVDALHHEPTAAQREITVRYLGAAIRMLMQEGDLFAAQQLYAQLKTVFPAGEQAPSFDEVIHGERAF